MRALSDDPPNLGVEVERLHGDPLSQREMYVRCNFPVPSKAPDGFDLVVPGKPSRFVTLNHLQSFELVNQDIVLECAGNGRSLMNPVPEGTPWDLDGVSPVSVAGYRLADVIGDLPDEVVDMVFTGADVGTVEPEGRVPFQFSIGRDLALTPVPLLVTHIGDEPLHLVHGAPVRLIVPGRYAMMSVKWLVRVEASTSPFDGHFVKKYRFYRDQREPEAAPVDELAVRSIIVTPGDGDTISAGAVEITGSAWSGSSAVARVDVSVDGGGTWHDADLGRPMSEPWAPVRWAISMTCDPGPLDIVARATDTAGATQPLEPRWNANGYANNVAHRVTVQVG